MLTLRDSSHLEWSGGRSNTQSRKVRQKSKGVVYEHRYYRSILWVGLSDFNKFSSLVASIFSGKLMKVSGSTRCTKIHHIFARDRDMWILEEQ